MKMLYGVSLLAGILTGMVIFPNSLYRYFTLPPNTKFPREEKALLERLEADGTKIHGLAYMFLDGYLYEFPEELFAHPLVLPEFNHLEIHGGSIKGIPKRIEELKALQFLKILDNKIDKVPTSIGKLIRLKELSLGGNNLERVPPEIGNLTNLEVLNLYDNVLTSVPREIGNLKKLKTLDLHSNNLSELPDEIAALSENLQVLYLGGNKLSTEKQKKIKELLPYTKIYF